MGAICFSMLARKGGVGRTTTSMNLAGVWAKEGARTLCIDLDSQASLSRCLLSSSVVESLHPSRTVAALFDSQLEPEPEDVIHATDFEGLSVVPACDRLEEFNVTKPWTKGDQQLCLRRFINELGEDYDIVICDTGPNTCGMSAWAALAASHFVLSPVLCDAFGSQSIISVQQLVEHVQTTCNPSLRILGYFINMRQANTVMEAYENTLRRIHGPMVFSTVLSLAACYRQAVAERTPLAFKKGRSQPVKALFELAEEINTRICGTSERKEAA